jgi:adenine deaminase
MPRIQVARDHPSTWSPNDSVASPRPDDISVVEALRRLVHAGASPAEAIRATTFETARLFGWHTRGGSVAPNRFADLLILSANPLDDVGNVVMIEALVIDGRFMDGAERNARLARLPSR